MTKHATPNLPAIIYHVYLPVPIQQALAEGNVELAYGSIWEYSRFEIEPYATTYNKRVHVLPPPIEELRS